jgi:hypothetical protein
VPDDPAVTVQDGWDRVFTKPARHMNGTWSRCGQARHPGRRARPAYVVYTFYCAKY